MAKKNTTNKPKDKVSEYLIDRIHELEYENRRLLENAKLNLERAAKYEKLKKCFYLEGTAIYCQDLLGNYVGIFAIECNEDFKDALALLDLTKEKGDFE